MNSLQNIPQRGLPEQRNPRNDVRDLAPVAPGNFAPDDEPLIDVNLIRDLLRFTRNACARHRLALIGVVSAFVLAALASQLLVSKKYYTETKLLADRNVVMPLLGNPGRRMADEADTPTRLAPEMILTRENLERIIKATDLIRHTDLKRSAVGRFRKELRERFSRKLTPLELMDEYVWLLRTRMNVRVADGTVIVGVVWTDPEGAFKIVQAAQDFFLQDRQQQEISLIAGSIAILEQRASDVQKDIGAMLDTLSKQRVALTPEEMRLFQVPAVRSTPIAGPSADLAAAQSRLDATSRAIADLEQFRSRRIAELQTTLAEQRNVYGPAHPLVENTEQALRVMQTETPQLVQLRRDEETQRAAVARLGGGTTGADTRTAITDQTLAATALRNLATVRIDSMVQEKQQYGKSRLRIAMSSYQALLERLEAARIELQTVRATFQYKYAVLIPGDVPKDALGMKLSKVVILALLVGGVLAVLTAVALDLASGRVLESWQISRVIGLPVLGSARPSRA